MKEVRISVRNISLSLWQQFRVLCLQKNISVGEGLNIMFKQLDKIDFDASNEE